MTSTVEKALMRLCSRTAWLGKWPFQSWVLAMGFRPLANMLGNALFPRCNLAQVREMCIVHVNWEWDGCDKQAITLFLLFLHFFHSLATITL